MACSERSSGTSTAPKKETPQPQRRKRKSRPQGLPSPALCCACGLCIMLAGINITLVGAFAFSTLMPSGNPPIIIGPVLLLVAFTFFGACCVCSRLPPPQSSRRAKGGAGGGGLGFMGRRGGGGGWGGGLGSGAAFEIETSEHTMQDTTAVQLSPTNSPTSSHGSSPELEATATALETDPTPAMVANANATIPAPEYSPPRGCKLFTMETNGPSTPSATFISSGATGNGGAVRLTLPSDGVGT